MTSATWSKARQFGFSKEALMEMGRKHWKKYLPTRFKALTTAGTLNQELEAAADLTLQEMADHRAAGFQVHEAWEMAREHHLILREEADEGEAMPDNPAYDAMAEASRVMRQDPDGEG